MRENAVERDQAAYLDGCEAARVDIATGRLVYRWHGHAGHWGHWIATRLFERFGMEIEGLGICFVTNSSVSFNDGYNSVLEIELDGRYGPGAFRSIFVESRNQSEESLADAKKLWLMRHSDANIQEHN